MFSKFQKLFCERVNGRDGSVGQKNDGATKKVQKGGNATPNPKDNSGGRKPDHFIQKGQSAVMEKHRGMRERKKNQKQENKNRRNFKLRSVI